MNLISPKLPGVDVRILLITKSAERLFIVGTYFTALITASKVLDLYSNMLLT